MRDAKGARGWVRGLRWGAWIEKGRACQVPVARCAHRCGKRGKQRGDSVRRTIAQGRASRNGREEHCARTRSRRVCGGPGAETSPTDTAPSPWGAAADLLELVSGRSRCRLSLQQRRSAGLASQAVRRESSRVWGRSQVPPRGSGAKPSPHPLRQRRHTGLRAKRSKSLNPSLENAVFRCISRRAVRDTGMRGARPNRMREMLRQGLRQASQTRKSNFAPTPPATSATLH